MKKYFIFTLLLLMILLCSCQAAATIDIIHASATPNPPKEVITIKNTATPASTSDVPVSTVVNTEVITTPSHAPSDNDFVRILDYISNIHVQLKYATADNFTRQIIYKSNEAYLRYGTVKKLVKVQEELTDLGYSLNVWDAFRPVTAQFKLWEVYPDIKFVANPNKRHSSHSKGSAVVVTLVTLDGADVNMPTAFDAFSSLADRDYSDVENDAGKNAILLEHYNEEARV